MLLVRVAKEGDTPTYRALAALFFLQAMASGMWLVPLSTVLAAHGFNGLRSFAYATTAIAALVSPLLFGAMADRHAPPVLVLRCLAFASAIGMAAASWAIDHHLPWGWVLAAIQVYALCAIPTGSLSTTIIFSNLKDSQRQYGPIRAAATVGWIAGCIVISALQADATVRAGYTGAVVWLLLALYTFTLPAVPPPPGSGATRWTERMGWDALTLLRNPSHRVVFVSAALLSIPYAAFYPFTPPHLQSLGFAHTSAWMSLGQITEVFAMFGLSALFVRWRLKWIFASGMAFGVLRYALCALDSRLWLLSGIFLHGLAFTFFYITAQIYLNERVETAWRARAQALMSLMTSGIGNLLGYLGTGAWLSFTSTQGESHWSIFWTGLSGVVAAVLVFFLWTYRGTGLPRRDQLQSPHEFEEGPAAKHQQP